MLLIRNGRVLDPASGTDAPRDILLDGDRIAAVAPHGQLAARAQGAEIFDASEFDRRARLYRFALPPARAGRRIFGND